MKKLVWIFCLAGFVTLAQTKPAAKQQPKAKKETKKTAEVIPDRKASFVGGTTAMDNFILQNLKTPEKLKTDTAIKTRTVFMKFMIDSIGRVSNVTVMKGIKGCKPCNDEAVRVITIMPNWIPAAENNQTKSSWFNLPINFTKD